MFFCNCCVIYIQFCLFYTGNINSQRYLILLPSFIWEPRFMLSLGKCTICFIFWCFFSTNVLPPFFTCASISATVFFMKLQKMQIVVIFLVFIICFCNFCKKRLNAKYGFVFFAKICCRVYEEFTVFAKILLKILP